MSTDTAEIHKQLMILENEENHYQKRIEAMIRLWELDAIEYKDTIAKYLTHEDFLLREWAITILANRWQLAEYKETAISMIESDPDEDVRRYALTGLGSIMASTKDSEVIKLYLKIINDPNEDVYIAQGAYDSLLRVLGIKDTRPFSEVLSIETIEDYVHPEVIKQAEELVHQKDGSL